MASKRKKEMTPEERAYWDEWLKKPLSEIQASAMDYWKDKPTKGLTTCAEKKGGWGVQI